MNSTSVIQITDSLREVFTGFKDQNNEVKAIDEKKFEIVVESFKSIRMLMTNKEAQVQNLDYMISYFFF